MTRDGDDARYEADDKEKGRRMSDKQNGSRGVLRRLAVRRRAGGVGAVALLTAATVASTPLLPAPAASAALPAARGTVQHRHTASTGPGCTLSPAANPPAVSPADVPAGGGSTSSSTEDVRSLLSNGVVIGGSRTTSATTLSFTTAGGGLSTLAVSTSSSGSVTAYSNPCGDASRIIAATALGDSAVVQPVTRAGWLDLSATSSGVASPDETIYQVYLRNPADPASTGADPVVSQGVAGRASSRVYLPAGWLVGVTTSTRLDLLARQASTAALTRAIGLSLTGRFTPAGAATGGERGKRLARRAVALPSAVACSSGRAGVRLTKVAKKQARSVRFLVNGHPVKHVKRIKRARSYAVRVPVAGPITITAKVTPKHGKKVSVRRSYAACH